MARLSHYEQYTDANKYQVQELEEHYYCCDDQRDRLLPDFYVAPRLVKVRGLG